MNSKSNLRPYFRRHILGKISLTLVVVASTLTSTSFAPLGVSAQPNSIAQAYQISPSSTVSTGTLVSLAASGSNAVESATASTASKLVGITASKPVFELSAAGTSHNTVQVAVGGSTEALVSDANGTVNTGDEITVSPIAGIGMRAIGSGEVVGSAQTSLSKVKTVSQSFKGVNGKDITIHVGLIPVSVDVAYYSAASSTGSVSAFVPPFLQNLANAVAGKMVSPLRVLIGTSALLLGFFVVTVMLYTGVRNGVISLGRNPLAASVLRQGMVDVLIGAVGVLVVTGAIVGALVLT